MKKRKLLPFIIAAAVLIVGIGITVAYLVASTPQLENTFTVGKVEISLNETTGDAYKMAPGFSIHKDPTITVDATSEACWLFVRITKQGNFDYFCTAETEEGWTALPNNNGVYYRKVESTSANQSFKVLKDDQILVKETITEEDLTTLNKNPTLTFTAYAVQFEGNPTAHDGWLALNQREE